MKPQKKAVVAKKATKMPTIAKKRRTILEKTIPDIRKEKKSKKQEKIEESRKKMEGERKKMEKPEEKKKSDEKKKAEERKKEKIEKTEEKKKTGKEQEKKVEKTEEKKGDAAIEKMEKEDCNISDNVEKKKPVKVDEKAKVEKIVADVKKKIEKSDEKKNSGKMKEEGPDDVTKQPNNTTEKNTFEEKEFSNNLSGKKKSKDEKKKEVKVIKIESKDGSKSPTMKEKEKKADRKKEKPEKEGNGKPPLAKTKKDSKPKQQPQKKTITKKTVLAKKPNLPVVKKLVDKKIKLVKPMKEDDTGTSEEEEGGKKKKKNNSVSKSKLLQEKKPKLAKPMKAKITQKHTKVTAVLAKNEKLKQLAQKMVAKKKIDLKDTEKLLGDSKKVGNKNEASNETGTNTIKSEPTDEKEPEKCKEEDPQQKSQDMKKPLKSSPKLGKKVVKKGSKPTKPQNESNNQKPTSLPEDVPSEESYETSKVCEGTAKTVVASKEEPVAAENLIELNLKVETVNGESTGSASTTSDSEDEPEEDGKRNKSRDTRKKERSKSPSDERARRMRLFGFWSGPKRHRVASLNALAKVHCLYENETGGVYLGGFCKPKPEKEKPKKSKEEKEELPRKEKEKEKDKEKEKKVESKTEENIPKRKLRNVPGLRGKHWDMLESSSSPSSSDEESEREKNAERGKKKITKRRKRNEEVMDLKDMVVCKRMASLNATAILAASYSDEKNRCGSSSSSSTTCESSSDSEIEIIKRRKQTDSDLERKKLRQGSDPEEVIKPSKKVVIVNQDTDVTITGVYVNQTRSTHHEGFCSIAGMQYRISSTSHTQTAATAVATELHDQQKSEQPCKSYTPLGALSSMQPPGSQGNHPNMSPRRHSAFSAPHQHGYYQPAGPLIQHPPTLPPIKGPPPDPTPTPPQNSEGSDDLVATSTTSGGTSNTGGGGFYRAYCPQYYGTPPQYQDLCYPPTYSHPHAHPPPYYKYAPAYRRQYYGYQESGGGGGPAGGGGTGGAPPPGVGVGVGVVEYQPPPPPPPGEYPLPYYPGYPPPPPPPAPNPAYLHTQGRPFVDHAAFQGCPCPMQSCPKNVDTGPLIGNGKGAPVVSGPGLSLPPSALVGPPSPARGLAGLAPPHGANAWDTDRVQLNTHRNLDQNQSSVQPASRNLVGGHNRPQNHRADCRTKDEKSCAAEEKLGKCGCQKHACTSASCEVKMETLSPGEKLTAVTNCPSSKYHDFKLENNNVKCESCSVEIGENISNCTANCNVKCESDFKCDIIKCEQCMKEGQMAILQESHYDKDSGILSIDDKLEADTDVKEELNEGITIDGENWKKPDYEPTVQETVLEEKAPEVVEERPKCQKLTKRKLSLDSLSDSRKKRKLGKRTLSVGSSQDLMSDEQPANIEEITQSRIDNAVVSADESGQVKKKQQQQQQQQQTKKESQGQKRKLENASNPGETAPKKMKSSKGTLNGITNCFKAAASETSIMETINDVIQQSLQMTKKKDRKSKACEKTERKKEKKSVHLLTTIKKVSKKVNAVKELATEKLSKIVPKSAQTKNKPESKTKSKSQENKLKAKSKCKQQDSKPEKADAKVKTQDVKLKVPDPKPKVQDLKTKVQDAKPKGQDSKVKDVAKKQEVVQKTKATNDVAEDLKCKKKRKNAKKGGVKKIAGGCKVNDSPVASEGLMLPRKSFLKPKWSNGWSWEGESFEAKVYLTNEESAIRRCYASMKHESGDVLRPRDCVLLKSGPRKADLPFVAKIAALWENPDDGEMMFSLLWYYRPEHTEQGRTQYDTEDEVFASRHRDANSVACIEDKCYILTFNEYCRYRKNLRRIEEGLESPGLIVPPGDQVYPRENRQPPIPVSSDMVLFCRRVYDYRGKKLVKNPG